MLNKASIFSLIVAVIAIAPSAAFAQDQVAGSNSTVNQGSTTVGNFNTTGQSGTSATYQDQFKNQFCGGGNQVAGSNTGVSQGSGTFGSGNVTGQSGSSTTGQSQTNACSTPYYGY